MDESGCFPTERLSNFQQQWADQPSKYWLGEDNSICLRISNTFGKSISHNRLGKFCTKRYPQTIAKERSTDRVRSSKPTFRLSGIYEFETLFSFKSLPHRDECWSGRLESKCLNARFQSPHGVQKHNGNHHQEISPFLPLVYIFLVQVKLSSLNPD